MFVLVERDQAKKPFHCFPRDTTKDHVNMGTVPQTVEQSREINPGTSSHWSSNYITVLSLVHDEIFSK